MVGLFIDFLTSGLSFLKNCYFMLIIMLILELTVEKQLFYGAREVFFALFFFGG